MSTRHVNWIFNLLMGRRPVAERSLHRHTDMIRIHLDEAKCDCIDRIPESALLSVVQEAYRRAAEGEPDRRARYGPHHEQLYRLSQQIVAALKEDPAADSRICRILVAHGALDEPDHTVEPPAGP